MISKAPQKPINIGVPMPKAHEARKSARAQAKEGDTGGKRMKRGEGGVCSKKESASRNTDPLKTGQKHPLVAHKRLLRIKG